MKGACAYLTLFIQYGPVPTASASLCVKSVEDVNIYIFLYGT
jgi:hypothetical protein